MTCTRRAGRARGRRERLILIPLPFCHSLNTLFTNPHPTELSSQHNATYNPSATPLNSIRQHDTRDTAAFSSLSEVWPRAVAPLKSQKDVAETATRGQRRFDPRQPYHPRQQPRIIIIPRLFQRQYPHLRRTAHQADSAGVRPARTDLLRLALLQCIRPRARHVQPGLS